MAPKITSIHSAFERGNLTVSLQRLGRLQQMNRHKIFITILIVLIVVTIVASNWERDFFQITGLESDSIVAIKAARVDVYSEKVFVQLSDDDTKALMRYLKDIKFKPRLHVFTHDARGAFMYTLHVMTTDGKQFEVNVFPNNTISVSTIYRWYFKSNYPETLVEIIDEIVQEGAQNADGYSVSEAVPIV